MAEPPKQRRPTGGAIQLNLQSNTPAKKWQCVRTKPSLGAPPCGQGAAASPGPGLVRAPVLFSAQGTKPAPSLWFLKTAPRRRVFFTHKHFHKIVI